MFCGSDMVILVFHRAGCDSTGHGHGVGGDAKYLYIFYVAYPLVKLGAKLIFDYCNKMPSCFRTFFQTSRNLLK